MKNKQASCSVKLKDIAEILNVSVNTVSRALRDMNDISPNLKEKVKKLAKEMNYIPNQISDYIREGRTSIVGIVISSISNPYFMLASNELIYCLQNEGYIPMILISNENLFTEDLLVRFINNRVCGIVSFCDVSNGVFEFCDNNKMPLITVGVTPLNKKIDAVYNDDYYTGKLVAEEFKKTNRNKPCYINSDLVIVNKFRNRGFSENIGDAKIDEYFIKYSERENEINDIVKNIKLNKNDFIFCFNDEIANFVIDSLNEANYKDYIIYGADGIPKYFSYSKKFNSVGYSFEKIIKIVSEILIDKIKNTNMQTTQIKYKGELIKYY